MAERTEIAWTDSTFNPWWGCTRAGPGCDHCYAEALDKRTGGAHWGPRTTPRRLSDSNWRKPVRWHKAALETGVRRRVFCGSMCDVFDRNAPERQREGLWQLIRSTPMLDWQLLTKRAPNIERYLPEDWGIGYDNVWLGVTVEDRKHGLTRMERLKQIPAKVRFLSCEPLLEDLDQLDLTGIHWVIVGGESGPYARPMDASWVTSIHRQCIAQNVPFFFKQWGGRKHKGGCRIGGEEIKQWPHIHERKEGEKRESGGAVCSSNCNYGPGS